MMTADKITNKEWIKRFEERFKTADAKPRDNTPPLNEGEHPLDGLRAVFPPYEQKELTEKEQEAREKRMHERGGPFPELRPEDYEI